MKIKKEQLNFNLIEDLKNELVSIHSDLSLKKDKVIDQKFELEIKVLNLSFFLLKRTFRGLLIVDYIIDKILYILFNLYFYYKREGSGEFFLNFANTFLIFSILIKYKVYLIELYSFSLETLIKVIKNELYFSFCNNKKINKEVLKINKKLNFELMLHYIEFEHVRQQYLDLKHQINFYFRFNLVSHFFSDFDSVMEDETILEIESNFDDSFDINYIFNEIINEMENLSLEPKIIKNLNLNLDKLLNIKLMDYGIKFRKRRVELPFKKIVMQYQLEFKGYDFYEYINEISYKLYLSLAKFLFEKKKLFKLCYKEDLNLR